MPNRSLDLNDAIRSLVANEVEAALGPHREALARISAFLGIASPASGRAANRLRGPGRRAAGGRRGAPRRAVGRGDASKFKEGQEVRYRQGRGEFEAKVIRIDGDTNTVVLERAKDKKRVERPASKVYA
jgi:hypothetical protein